MKLKILLALLILLIFMSKAENVQEDEIDAVIEFDESDDLFMFLSQRESTVIHLYSRKDS